MSKENSYATIICSYKKGRLIYATAKTKDDFDAFFYYKIKDEKHAKNVNSWLKSIFKLAQKSYYNQIDQSHFFDQFTVIHTKYYTEYIHKKDMSLNFRMMN